MLLKPRDKRLNDVLRGCKGGEHELDESHKNAKRAKQKQAWKKELRNQED